MLGAHCKRVIIIQEALQSLLERDSFFAPEVDIFKAVCSWFNANQLWVKTEGGQPQVVSLNFLFFLVSYQKILLFLII